MEETNEVKPKKTRIVFTGKGFHRSVPARDLRKTEWNRIPKRLQDSLLKQGIYKVVEE